MLRTFKYKFLIPNFWLLSALGASLTLNPTGIYAQSANQQLKVSGYVTDEYSNPIGGATITLGNGKQVMTNSDGYFEAATVKGDKFKVSFITMITQEDRKSTRLNSSHV